MFQLLHLEKRLMLLLTALLSGSYLFAQYTVRFELKGKPLLHAADTVYLAGSFNNWNPGLHVFAFQSTPGGDAFIELKSMPKGLIEFKLTRGTWTKAETAANGASIANRICKINSDTVIKLTVDAWVDDFPTRPPVSTRSKNVFVIDTAFAIPQLHRTRRIWIYLPEDYVFSKKRYPVMYMHDGQNLFDALTASFGEWGIDEMMDSLQPRKQCIVVGIDHGADKRMTEYNPYPSRFGAGEGDAYVDFLVKTLKPSIDKKYRTKTEKESTFIAGSSMGGLISLYAVLKYPDVFGGAGVFSPAFWLAPQLSEKLDSVKNINSAVYFVCGELESTEMTVDMKKVYDSLRRNGSKKLSYRQVADGRHNEAFWRKEMPGFYQWLFVTQMR